MVAKFPFATPKVDDKKEDDYYNLPRLFGRAEIQVRLKEIVKKKGEEEEEGDGGGGGGGGRR